MLNLLVDYARACMAGVEPGFAAKEVRWAILCNEEGEFLDVVEMGDVEAKRNPGREFKKCPQFGTEMQGGGMAHFLVETVDVICPAVRHAGEEPPAKTRQKHAYFVRLLREAASAAPELALFARLLEAAAGLQAIADRLIQKKAGPNDKMTLGVKGATATRFLVESEAWHDWWRAFRAGLQGRARAGPGKRRAAAVHMRCLVDGALVEPCATHPKVKGLVDVGGHTAGDVLIGCDKEAFCSYGLEKSANAALSEEAASAYVAALNHLIRESGHRLAGAKVVHWFKKSVRPEEDLVSWLIAPPASEESAGGATQEEMVAQQRAKQLLEAIDAGRRPDLRDNHYYALTLSGAAGRVMVRDWMEGRFDELVRNVNAWFEDLSIVRSDGSGRAREPRMEQVVTSMLGRRRQGQKYGDWIRPIGAVREALWRVAVRRERIPRSAVAQAARRAAVDIIADEPANHARMGLLKAYHVRHRQGETHMQPYLNELHPEPAYHCGRLMSVLAAVQRRALPGVGAGLVQRYYAAASSTPALVLGRLTRTSQFHLDKLAPGPAHWFEGRIADIWGRIRDRLPATLTLEQQSLFALGYYQQMAADRAGRQEKSEPETEETGQ